jgi:hypothetical protein
MLLTSLALVLSAADPSPFSANEPAMVFARVSSSVLVVKATVSLGTAPQGTAQGSAVVVGKGVAVTNFHVVKRSTRVTVTQGATTVEAKLMTFDEKRDLALLSFDGLERRPIAVATARALKVGDRVYAIGAPHSLELTLSDGLVSALREDAKGGAPTIQTTAPISPGSSGGGLFDGHGRLVGITTFQSKDGQNLNFANPAEWVSDLLQGKMASVAADAGAAPMFTVASRPKDIRCQLSDRSTWGLFSDGPELLESQPYQRELTFWDFDGQTPLRGSDTLVLRDLSRKSQFVNFEGGRNAQYFFVFDDDGAIKLIFAEAANFRGQPRLVTTSGDCVPSKRTVAVAKGISQIPATEDDACNGGDAKACLRIASQNEDGIALVYFRRACEGGELSGCDQAADLYERVGDKGRAGKYRAMGVASAKPEAAPAPAPQPAAKSPTRSPLGTK